MSKHSNKNIHLCLILYLATTQHILVKSNLNIWYVIDLQKFAEQMANKNFTVGLHQKFLQSQISGNNTNVSVRGKVTCGGNITDMIMRGVGQKG